MKKLIILGGVALMTASSFSMASNGIKSNPTFESLDSNSDGVITLVEAESIGRFAKRFANIDADNSQTITKPEFDSMLSNKGNKRAKSKRVNFEKLDINNNGEVTEEEFNIMVAAQKEKQAKKIDSRPTFANLDKNNDGKLSADELKAMRSHKKGKKGRKGNKYKYPAFNVLDVDMNGQLSPQEYSNITKAKKVSKLVMLDTDQNGSVSEQEFNAMLEEKQLKRAEREASRPAFGMIDSNDNSVITEDEFTVFQQKHASKVQRK